MSTHTALRAILVSVVMLFTTDALTSRSSFATTRPSPRSHSRGTITMRKGRPSTKIGRGLKSNEQPSSSKVNWVQIAASESELPSDDGGTKALDLGGKVYMVLKKNDNFHLLGSSCTKCQFPLLNSEIDEADGTLVCNVCGSKFQYQNGGAIGRVTKEGIAGWFGNVMSSKPGGNIEAFVVRTNEAGKVYAAFGTK